ncbi:MAG: hypothetical protein ACM3X0_00880 [Bacteroidota bacterium]
MKTRLFMIVSTLLAALLCPPAIAQPAPAAATATDNATPAAPGMMPGNRQPRMRSPRDCSQAPDPAACTARRAARDEAMAACQDKAGPQRRECMQVQMQNVDCSKMGNPERCAAHKAASQACQGQSGPALRQCMQDKMPPVDCSKSARPQRCAARQEARAACADRPGPQHRACMTEQLKAK